MNDNRQNPNLQPASTTTQHIVIHHEQRSYHGIVITSWVLIFLACGLAVIPVLGFAAWIIAFPVFLATFILSIIAMSRGGALQGVLILTMSIFIGPIIVAFAPLVTSMLGVVGVGVGVAGVGGAAIVEIAKDQEKKEKMLVGKWLKDEREVITFDEDKSYSIDSRADLGGTWSVVLNTLNFANLQGGDAEQIIDLSESKLATKDFEGVEHTYIKR